MVRAASTQRAEQGSMTELRKLVFGDDEKRVAAALPRAVTLRAQSDRKLAIAIEPLLADTLRDVATRHPEKLADALQPIIGSAVRKAVSAAFAALLQRVNQALEHRFSVKSLRWRLEAARTGRPFAEIVLLHSLVYRVEQVFLVHRPTGLLLAHAATDPEDVRDPDQVAAMINVIEKFVRDAFREGATLTRFEVGDLQGRSEIGAEAAITAVVRGSPPEEELSRVLREALERIHLEFRDQLIDFHNDTSSFAPADEILKGCLVERRVDRRRSLLLPVLAGLLAIAIGFLIGRDVLQQRANHQQLRAYESALRAEPGVIVTGATRDGEHLILTGYRDPLAPDAAAILSARGLDPARATVRLQPFYSLDPRFVQPRVLAALSPPPTVAVTVERGTVRITGVASREWLLRARTAAGLLPGVTAVEAGNVREREAIDDIASARTRIERPSFLFATGSAELDRADDVRLDALAREIDAVRKNGAAAGVTARFVADAYADASGSTATNRALSRARADAIVAALTARGVPATVLDARGVGEKSDESDPKQARRAAIRVVLEGAP